MSNQLIKPYQNDVLAQTIREYVYRAYALGATEVAFFSQGKSIQILDNRRQTTGTDANLKPSEFQNCPGITVGLVEADGSDGWTETFFTTLKRQRGGELRHALDNQIFRSYEVPVQIRLNQRPVNRTTRREFPTRMIGRFELSGFSILVGVPRYFMPNIFPYTEMYLVEGFQTFYTLADFTRPYTIVIEPLPNSNILAWDVSLEAELLIRCDRAALQWAFQDERPERNEFWFALFVDDLFVRSDFPSEHCPYLPVRELGIGQDGLGFVGRESLRSREAPTHLIGDWFIRVWASDGETPFLAWGFESFIPEMLRLFPDLAFRKPIYGNEAEMGMQEPEWVPPRSYVWWRPGPEQTSISGFYGRGVFGLGIGWDPPTEWFPLEADVVIVTRQTGRNRGERIFGCDEPIKALLKFSYFYAG